MKNYHENLTAEQIRQQMNYVRRELNVDVEQVVEDANSLSDLRAYVKAQPVGWVIGAALAGFLVVPARKHKSQTSTFFDEQGLPANGNGNVNKSSILGAAAGLALTAGTRLVTKLIADAGMGLISKSHYPEAARQPSNGAKYANFETENG